METLHLPEATHAQLHLVAGNIASLTAALVAACPAPTRADIHKLLAVQAYCLNEHGLALLHLSKADNTKNKKAIIELGLRLVSEGRKSFASLLADPSFDRGTGEVV